VIYESAEPTGLLGRVNTKKILQKNILIAQYTFLYLNISILYKIFVERTFKSDELCSITNNFQLKCLFVVGTS